MCWLEALADDCDLAQETLFQHGTSEHEVAVEDIPEEAGKGR